MNSIIGWISLAVRFGTVIMFGSLGEIMTQKSGNLNLGVPGIMYLGAFSGFIGAYAYENSTENPSALLCILLALLAGFSASLLGGLIYSFLTITLRANQNVTGLALTTFGSGIANFFGTFVINDTVAVKADFTSRLFIKPIPYLSSGLGAFGRIFFSHGFLVYAAVALAIFLSWFLNRTRAGLNLRAVGENPATADAAGINVTKYKYLATCLGAGITGLGGLFYIFDYNNGIWATTDDIGGLGWLAVALVIFTTWKPVNAIWGAYIFGLLYWLYQYLPSLLNINIPADLARMAPYVVTIIVLIVISLRRKKEDQAPSSLGVPYFREER